jgi:hypothetical protein
MAALDVRLRLVRKVPSPSPRQPTRPSIRAWQAGFELAAARERARLRESGPNSNQAIAVSLSLIATAREQRLGARFSDPVRRKGERAVRETWRRLKSSVGR